MQKKKKSNVVTKDRKTYKEELTSKRREAKQRQKMKLEGMQQTKENKKEANDEQY